MSQLTSPQVRAIGDLIYHLNKHFRPNQGDVHFHGWFRPNVSDAELPYKGGITFNPNIGEYGAYVYDMGDEDR